MPARKVPVEQRLLEGTYKASRHGPIPAPAVQAGAPEKPKSLKGEAAKVWKELLALLTGRVQASDGPMLANLCRWWSRMDALQQTLDGLEPGSVVYGRAMIQAGIATDKVNKIAAAFGLTPADRAKLGVPSATTAQGARVWT